MAGFDPQAEAMLQQAVAQTIGPVAHLDKQYNGEQIQKMILDYAGRAAKRKASSKAWTEVASDFTYSFFESLWKVFGESPWLDQVDFTWVVGLAFRTHLSTPALASVSEEEYNQIFAKETAMGLDCSRYYSWSAFVLKKIVSGKASQKKVRDAVDNTREELLKNNWETAEQFAEAWIQGAVKALGKDVGNVLPKSMAHRLFEAYVKEGGGIPLWLMNAVTPGCLSQVKSTVEAEYASIPEEDMGGGFGKGGGYGKAGGGYGKGKAADPWGFGGKGGGDAWGMGMGMGMGGMGMGMGNPYGGYGGMGAYPY